MENSVRIFRSVWKLFLKTRGLRIMNLFKYAKGGHKEIEAVFQVSRGYTVISENDNFIVAYLEEPTIKFSKQLVSTMFPRQLSSVKQFYTGSGVLNATLKFYYLEKDARARHLLNELKKVSQRLNFNLHVEPVERRDYHEVSEEIFNAVKSTGLEGNKANIIVGGIFGPAIREPYFFEKVKALSIINRTPTHLININKLNDIVRECKEELKQCGSYRTYVLNNIVQLYAKAGGIPWIPGEEDLLRKSAVIGIATASMKRSNKEEYIIGAAFSIAYFGEEIRSYITASIYDRSELDEEIIKSKGIYVPRETVNNLISKITEMYSKWGVNQYVIFQSPIVHYEELKGLNEMSDVLRKKGIQSRWILVHVKTRGFSKRIYDANTLDWGPYRGMCILDKDYISTFGKRGIVKTILASTGWIKIKRGNKEYEEQLYKATPRPLELEIYVDDAKIYKEPAKLAIYISRLVLLLGKLDWEACTNWPKEPFVIKYARRLAKVIARIDEETRKTLLNTLTSPVALRFIM
jgi:hypothetical protein